METRWLGPIIGLVIAAASIGAAVLLWLTVGADYPLSLFPQVQEAVLFGWDVLYARVRPPSRVVWAAVAIAILAAASVAVVERLASRRARRSTDVRETPLSPVVQMPLTRRYAGPVTVTVLIPSHNEEPCCPRRFRRCCRSHAGPTG